jgi:hypothetical protein
VKTREIFIKKKIIEKSEFFAPSQKKETEKE